MAELTKDDLRFVYDNRNWQQPQFVPPLGLHSNVAWFTFQCDLYLSHGGGGAGPVLVCDTPQPPPPPRPPGFER